VIVQTLTYFEGRRKINSINRLSLGALTCILICWNPAARAEVPVSNYAAFKKNVPQFKDYLIGLGRGIFWANTLLTSQGKPNLFCMPEDLILDDASILSLIDHEIRQPSAKKPWSNDTTVEMVAAFAFVSRFPCTQRKN
jgi:hypothetical protein